MAGNIKGITIEFNGDTTRLDKALRSIDKETRSIDRELKQVNNALKFNPTNIELWRQKQTLLSQKIEETRKRLDALRQAQAKMDADGVDKTSAEYRELQREIITTTSKLDNFEGQLKQIGNAKLKALSEQFKELGGKMTAAGQTMTMKVTAPIVAGYTAAAKYASDYEENLNKLDVAFGSNSKSVKEWANNARDAYGLSKVQATDAASAFGALGKGIGLTEKQSAEMSTTLAGLSADLGSYFNVGTEESAKALEGIFTGESEALKKFGVVMTDTNLQQFAADQGLVWNEMSQTEKTMLRYQYVLAKTKDAQGDFARTNDGTANSLKIFRASVQDLGTAIGTNLLPIVTPVIQKAAELINKFNELSPAAQKVITIVGLIVAAIGPALVIIGTLANAIGSIISLVNVIGPMLAGMSGTIGIVVAVIAALVAVGILVYKNWDTIKAKALEVKEVVVNAWNALKARVVAIFNGIKSAISTAWNVIKANTVGRVKGMVAAAVGTFLSLKAKATSTFNAIKNAIMKPIQTAVNTVKRLLNKVKGFFPIKAGKLLSGIKLPHFKISGSFSIKKKTVPHLSIDWYKTGGIFNSPTIAGIGDVRGGEAVVPLDKFWRKLENLQGGDSYVLNIYANDGMNVDQLVSEIQRRIIETQNRKRVAYGGNR